MTRLALLLTLTALAACKPGRDQCEAAAGPLPVQLLASAGPALNPCEDGQPCPLLLQVYELKSGAGLEQLDFRAVFEQREKAFGDGFVKLHEFELFPDQRERWSLELSPDTTHVVSVGLFRETLGDGWYQVFAVPVMHHQAACDAAARGKPIGDPCIYLSFDEYEVAGGRFPPAGFDVRAFEAACAPVATPPAKPRKKPRRPPTLPSLPTIPKLPTAPTLPTTPAAPSTPSAPATPTAPQAPVTPRRTPR